MSSSSSSFSFIVLIFPSTGVGLCDDQKTITKFEASSYSRMLLLTTTMMKFLSFMGFFYQTKGAALGRTKKKIKMSTIPLLPVGQFNDMSRTNIYTMYDIYININIYIYHHHHHIRLKSIPSLYRGWTPDDFTPHVYTHTHFPTNP